MTRFRRYVLVGAAATATHGLVMAGLVEAAVAPPWLASGIGAAAGAQVAFEGNRRLTFAHRGPRARAWWRFMSTAALGALLGMGVVALTVASGLHYLAAQALASVLVLVLGFVINRHWSFSGS